MRKSACTGRFNTGRFNIGNPDNVAFPCVALLLYAWSPVIWFYRRAGSVVFWRGSAQGDKSSDQS